MGGADHDHRLDLPGRLRDGLLPVGGGVADVFDLRRMDLGEALAQGDDDFARVVDRQRGLRDEGERLALGHNEPRHIVGRAHQRHRAVRQLAHGPDDLGVSDMAD